MSLHGFVPILPRPELQPFIPGVLPTTTADALDALSKRFSQKNSGEIEISGQFEKNKSEQMERVKIDKIMDTFSDKAFDIVKPLKKSNIGKSFSAFSPVLKISNDYSIDQDMKLNSPRGGSGKWTVEQDNLLRNAVETFEGKNWKEIARCVPGGRTDVQCLHRWQKVLKPGLIKGPWTKEEDDLVIKLVAKYGGKKWSMIASALNGRLGKQCRERWYNHLDPRINKLPWTPEEDSILEAAYIYFGSKWAEIARILPGRYGLCF